MPIAATRGLLRAALEDDLEDVEYRVDPTFGFDVPVRVPGVQSRLLDPRSTWRDPEAYDAQGAGACGDVPRELRALPGRGRGRPPRRASALTRSAEPFRIASLAVEAKHDVLIVGAGCAGMRAAIEAFDAGADVAVISKIHPTRSHSGAAEGGINAALGNASDDDPEKHAFDTVKGSDYLGDQDAIEVLCQEAPDDVYQLEHWGAVFSRTEDGRIAQRPFGAAGEPRTAYAADITGHVLVHVLYEQMMRRDITTYEEWFAWRLVEDDGRCQGVICWDILNGGLKLIGAKTVILAPAAPAGSTQGRRTPTPAPATAWRWPCALGVPLKDMEMMQFHPTTLSPTGVLITEGCRGEGAYLLNSEGERFLKNYAPNAMELASRDVISRAEQIEIDEGRGVDGNVLLDLRHLGAGEDPRALARDARALDGLRRGRPDPRADPGAARLPLPHGRRRHGPRRQDRARGALRRRRVRVRLRARRQPPRRQRAHGDDHLRQALRAGGGRLGASHNTVVAPPESALADAERELKELLDRADGERPHAIRDEMASTMHENFGVFRREEQMRAPGRDHRRPARALRARRRRGQGRRLQQRPHAGARARLPARARRVHGRGRARPQGEPRRARAPVRLPRTETTRTS